MERVVRSPCYRLSKAERERADEFVSGSRRIFKSCTVKFLVAVASSLQVGGNLCVCSRECVDIFIPDYVGTGSGSGHLLTSGGRLDRLCCLSQRDRVVISAGKMAVATNGPLVD